MVAATAARTASGVTARRYLKAPRRCRRASGPSRCPAAPRRCTGGTARTRRGSPRRSPSTAVADREDVDRADLGELGGDLRVGGDLGVTSTSMKSARSSDALAPISRCTSPGMSSICSATEIPASARRAIFSVAVSSLPSTIVPAWPKRHARHLVHEAAGHERDDRQARVVLASTQSRQLGLHAAARLGVDDDRLGLLVGLEQRHQLGVGRADDRVAADRDRGRLAEAGGA